MSTAESVEKKFMKPCALCGMEIPLGALKCSHCDSFQDWRKHLPFSSTVLSLLVALLSVLTVAAPALEKLFAPSDERIRVDVTGFSVTLMDLDHYRTLLGDGPIPKNAPAPPTEVTVLELQLLATNVGSKVGIVTGVTVDGIEIKSRDGSARTVSGLILTDKTGSSGSVVVAPNEFKLVRGFIPGVASFKTNQAYRLKVSIVNGKGEKVSRLFESEPLRPGSP
jgi:hypothetical protein